MKKRLRFDGLNETSAPFGLGKYARDGTAHPLHHLRADGGHLLSLRHTHGKDCHCLACRNGKRRRC